jgi:hypothetical protein
LAPCRKRHWSIIEPSKERQSSKQAIISPCCIFDTETDSYENPAFEKRFFQCCKCKLTESFIGVIIFRWG